MPSDAELARQREVVNAFFAASRAGDFEALVRVLDSDAVLRSDAPGIWEQCVGGVPGQQDPSLAVGRRLPGISVNRAIQVGLSIP